MKSQTRADLAMTAAIVFLGAALVFSGLSLLRLQWGNRAVAPSLGFPELLGVAGAGIGVALLCWWCFALSCAFVSAMAHRLGAHRFSAVTAGCSPAFMRRVVAAVLGIHLLTAPLASAAEAPGVDPLWQAQTVSTAPATPGATTSPVEDPLPPVSTQPVNPLWIPSTPDVDPDLLIRQPPRNNSGTAGLGDSASAGIEAGDIEAGDVVVKRGDTLWGIVAESLGPYSSDVDVALAWPQWYNANRSTIGTDPNLILPGQVLHAPGSY